MAPVVIGGLITNQVLVEDRDLNMREDASSS